MSRDEMLIGPSGLVLPAPLWGALRAAYGSPGRAYHTFAHVRDVVQRFDEVARDVGWQRANEAWLALLFHDAVYTPGAGDNEERSAQLASDAIEEWLAQSGIDRERVAELIRLTARHGKLLPDEVDRDAALLLDCDMAILGSDRETFDTYETGIATEYSSLPPEAFRIGRGRFIERLLVSPYIFLSDYFRTRFDATARSNLRCALERLAQD